jgi:iron complex transport system substrate-binding protein
MRIASLLPSATDVVCALGLETCLVGVSHSCDAPAAARLPRLTTSRVPMNSDSRAIDSAVRESVARGVSLYQIDGQRLGALAPDLVLTQDLCDVCAVGEAEVADALEAVCLAPTVLTLGPKTLQETSEAIRVIGRATGHSEQAEALVSALERRVAAVAAVTRTLPHRPRVAFLEWIDPPIAGGHWNPELVELAGGQDVLGTPGAPSRTVSWSEVAASEPDLLCIACCGFSPERARADLDLPRRNPAMRGLLCIREWRIAVFDGVGLFSRPGPRLAESLELLASAIHPQLFGISTGSSPTLRGMT